MGLLIFALKPANAATQWGIETNTQYKFELNKFLFFDNDLTPLLKDNVSMAVVFTELNDTGYAYDVYPNVGEPELGQSTVFEEVDTGFANVTLPIGLPIALPLSIGNIPNYFEYLGEFINQTHELVNFTMFEDFNMTDFNMTYIGENITLDSYSTLNSENFELHVDVYADALNDTTIDMIMANISSDDISLTIPDNITDFKLNITAAFSVTTGLFEKLSVTMRSQALLYGYPAPFNADILYSYNKPAEQTETTSTQPTETETPGTTSPTPYPIATTAVILIVGTIGYKLRKRF